MKRRTTLAVLFLGLSAALFSGASYETLGNLPLGSAVSTSSSDSFPYVQAAGSVTKRLTVWDIANIPSLTSKYATTANPVFTGTITAPGFIGPLTGNADTATALAANPTDCSSNQYASAIDARGNLTCSQPNFSNISGSIGVAQGGTGLSSGTIGGVLAFTGTTTAASTAAGTSGQILQSAGIALPVWSSASYPASTTANQILYSSETNTVAGLSSANTGVLVTDSSGVPSIQACTTANRVLRSNGTSLSCAQVAAGTDISGQIAIASGGTGQATASAAFDALSPMTTLGDIVYGGASGTGTRLARGTTGQLLSSNLGAAPSWTSAAYPQSTTINQILYSSAANTVSGISTANTGVLVTSSAGVPSIQACATANRVLRTDGTSLTCSQVAAATDVSGQLGVPNGGTGLASGTSGGVPYFSGTTTIASSGALSAHGVMLGGGAGATPTAIVPDASTAKTLVSGGSSADPSWATLGVGGGGTGLTSGTSGGIPYFSSSSAITSSGALTAHGVVIGGGAGTSPTSTAAGSSGQVLTSNGASSDPTFQSITATAPNDSVVCDTSNAYGSGSTKIVRFTNCTVTGTALTYTTSGDTSVLGSVFTINTTGDYMGTIQCGFSSTGLVGISINSNQLSTAIDSITQANRGCYSFGPSADAVTSCAFPFYGSVNDVIRPHFSGAALSSVTANCKLRIVRMF